MATNCIICSATINSTSATGRPRVYCDESCRRLAEYKIRAIRARLTKLWDNLSSLEHRQERNIRDCWGGLNSNRFLICAARFAAVKLSYSGF